MQRAQRVGRPRWRALAGKLTKGALACILVPVALLYAFQDRFVYLPSHEVPPVRSVLPTGEDVTYRTADGVTIHAWYVPPGSRQRTGADGRAPLAIVFHGNLGTRADMAPVAGGLARAGYAALVVEYRGFGDTEGAPSEPGLLLDAHAALDYVRGRTDVDPTRISYVGFSLGTGVATALACDSPPAALVLLAPFTSLPDVAWRRLPALPYRVLMRSRFDSADCVPRLHVPLLVVSASNDSIVPPEHGPELYRRANEPKRLVVFEGADHDLRPPSGQDAIAETVGFLSSLPR
jgi:hypothetical protein